MRSIHVTRTIPAPAELVFDRLADHANYDHFRGIHHSELVREGDPAPNGLGALRRIKVTPLVFEEEITAYDRPNRFDYLIVKLNVPFHHDGGSIRLTQADGGTHVDWRSSFSVPTPIIGGLEESIFLPMLNRGFRRVLEDVERMVTNAPAPVIDTSG
jgi:uncharacterized protein YndB with AHSA1/START domain